MATLDRRGPSIGRRFSCVRCHRRGRQNFVKLDDFYGWPRYVCTGEVSCGKRARRVSRDVNNDLDREP
jgi:hypothetical protein